MLFKKSLKNYRKKIDHCLTDSLLGHICHVDISSSEYLFIFSHEKNSFSKRLFTLVSRELSLMNIPSVFLYQNDSIASRLPTLSINGYQISNSLNYGKTKGAITSANLTELYLSWNIDIENQFVGAYNTNFFPIILCTLRKITKLYNIDFYDSDIKIFFNYLLKSCDLLLHYFLLFKEFSSKKNKKIRIVGFEKNYIPNGIFYILCEKFSKNRDIEFIELQRGYMAYFGKYHFRDSFITCTNLNKEKVSYGTALCKSDLDKIDSQKVSLDNLSKPLLMALNKKSFSKISIKKEEVISQINGYLKANRKIFVLFAHLFHDVPYDDCSSSFEDMCEWINSTIEFFKKNDNLLLLKPHPSELRIEEPNRVPNETFKSFLNKTQLSKNIILLEPNEFTLSKIAPYVSCGLIWRSSVAMELTFLGIPTIIAGSPIYSALPLNYSQNRQHYFQMIDGINSIEVTEAQKAEVAKYLYLLERKHIHVDCLTYDAKLRKVLWNKKVVEKYLANGDANIRSIAEKMLE
jgi:capsular polysaccharide export protein